MSSGELAGRSAVELVGMLTRHEVSAGEVLADHVARVEAFNPLVNAVVTFHPDRALDAARDADDRAARGETLGPLHGLPVAHKDLQETAGVRTTFGSPVHADFVPDVDALVVSRMRAAGAVSIGKTNVPEFGAGSQTFNPVFGATRNPWDTSRTCGGSSGGAAVALATGMVALADGSDMGGSLRNPASFCGVVGLRPSPGVVPSWPSRNAFGTLSTDGPMARSVADLALFLSVLAGGDHRVPVAVPGDPSRYGAPFDLGDLAGLRVAWAPTLGGLPVAADVLDATNAARGVFESLGAVTMDEEPPLAGADEVFEVLRAMQFEMGHGRLYDTRPADLKATVRWNIECGRRLTGPDIGRAETERSRIFQAMAGFFDEYDLLVGVVSQVAPFDVEVEYPTEIAGVPMNSYIEWMRSCSRITVTACPAMSLPAGHTAAGLPVGLQLVAPYRHERRLLEVAAVLERGLAPLQLPLPILS